MVSGVSKKKSGASFRLYERKEFVRELEIFGIGQHIFLTFKMLFLNWKIFLPLLAIMVIVLAAFVGLTGELLNNTSVGTWVFVGLVFLMIFLTTIFVLRHKMAGNKIGLRDTLYNSMTPLFASLVMLVIIAIECLPILLFVVAYSSAIETHFLETPFYALLFWVFSGLLFLLSGYFLSSSIMAMVAVTAPGLYPYEALKTTNDLMKGRRIKFILRLIALLLVLSIIWVILILPIIKFNLSTSIPIVSICLMIMGCFSAMYVTTYFYLYYRWVLEYDTRKEKNGKGKSRKKNK